MKRIIAARARELDHSFRRFSHLGCTDFTVVDYNADK